MSQNEILKHIPELYGITDSKNGYLVRLYYVKGKPAISNWFSSMEAAKKIRDNQLKRLYLFYGYKALPYQRKTLQKNNKR